MAYAMEATCVTTAKGSCKLPTSWFAKEKACGRRKRGGGFAQMLHSKRDVDTHLFNGVVQYSAGEGEADKAERWMEKFDNTKGTQPNIQALNALLQVVVKKGDIAKAEDWFKRPS